MRILEDKSDKILNMVTLFLTNSEALELIGCLENLIEHGDHSHFMSEDCKKEITICIYDPENPGKFSPRIEKLLKEDQ